jgi:hypothetical protein
MATLNELRAAIDDLLEITASTNLLQLNSNTPERAYEAYVLALCAEAVRKAGGTATPAGITSGPNPPVLIFRGAPGSMASANQDFCYIDCRLRGKSFEIHVDVEYVGQSGASHEVDVSFYDAQRAADVRSSGASPKMNHNLLFAFECKFYHSTPGVALARTFVGLLSDCSTNQLDAFVSNKTTRDLDRFLAKKSGPDPYTDLSPLDTDSEERFVRSLEQRLRKWAASR